MEEWDSRTPCLASSVLVWERRPGWEVDWFVALPIHECSGGHWQTWISVRMP